MSKRIYKSDRFGLTQFYDGEEIALQINSNLTVSFINVTEDSALELIEQLTKWIKSLKGLL